MVSKTLTIKAKDWPIIFAFQSIEFKRIWWRLF